MSLHIGKRILCLAILCPSFLPAADPAFMPPVMGYVFDGAARQIKSIVGVPGAARVAGAIDLDITAQHLLIGPGATYALASAPDADSLLLVRSLDSRPNSSPIDGAMKDFDSAAFSASGAAAIVFGSGCNCLQVLAGFPDAPRVIRTLDAGAFPAALSALAITDDATAAAVAGAGSEDGSSPGQVFLFDSTSASPPRPVIQTGATALAFSPNQKDLAIAGPSSVSLAGDVAGAVNIVPLGADGEGDAVSAPSALAFANENLLIAADSAGLVHLIDLQSTQRKSIACGCKPESIQRMNTSSIYRLTGTDPGAVWILEKTEPGGRVLFVPIDPGSAQ